MSRKHAARLAAAVAAAVAAAAAAVPASAATTPYNYGVQVSVDYTGTAHPASGVTEKDFTLTTSHGSSQGHLLEINLRDPHVSLGLVHAPYVADRQTLTSTAGAEGALAAINGDDFDISTYETDKSITTNSADGPEIANGDLLKSAVPQGQRIGGALPPGADPNGVIGVGTNGRAELGTVTVGGTIKSQTLTAPIAGYNVFALPQNSIGVFDANWGPAPRERAACGTDTQGVDPTCPPASSMAEAIVKDGTVISVSHTIGSGQLAPDEFALVGRENGSTQIEQLTIGEHVNVNLHPVEDAKVPFRWAVGGALTSVVGSQAVAGLTNAASDLNPYTSAGFTADGKTVYLVVLDGRSSVSTGVTEVELASLMLQLGCADAVQLDAGGSTEMIMKSSPSAASYSILNVPSDGAERPVPNGIGVFTKN